MDENAGKLVRYTEALDDNNPKPVRRPLAHDVLVRFVDSRSKSEFERMTGLRESERAPLPMRYEGTLAEADRQ